MNILLSYLFVVGAGISVALQQVINSNLRTQIGSPWWAGFISYFVGMVFMLILALGLPGPKLTLASIENTSWVSWTGGVLGAIFICIAILTVPRLGAATVLALIVVGQMLASIIVDHLGLLGVPQHSASPIRLIGAICLVAGVVLIRR